MRRRLLLLVATSAALLIPSDALAVAANDPLTEGGVHDVRSQYAADYTARSNHGCSIERDDDSLEVACNRGDYLWLEYTFRVPENAIDLRPRSDHTVTSSGNDGYIDVEGWRDGKRRYRASVVISNKIKVRVDALDLRLHLPDRRDDRRCVTRGEWATVVPQLGGSGGTRSEVKTTFDTDGKLVHISSWIDGFRHQTRVYRKCGGGKYRIGYHQYRGDPWWSYWG